jgi:hypothetical protein
VFVVVNGNGERQENIGDDSSSDDDDEAAQFIDNSLHRYSEDNIMEVGDIQAVVATANNPSFRRGTQPTDVVTPSAKKPRVVSVKEQHCIASKFHYWTDEMVGLIAVLISNVSLRNR